MRALTQSDLLALWESGRALHPLDQGLLALRAAYPETHAGAADWPIGQRNRALAQLGSDCFGPSLRGWTDCLQCREKLEFELDARALAARPLESGEPVAAGGRTFRLPTSRDLARVAAEPDARAATVRLVELCRLVGWAEPEDQAPAPTAWAEADLDAIGEKMALADPLAEIMLHFDCPTCGASFDESLDLAAFIWAEIEARAKRLLVEVHMLASAYGWREAEILSLGAARRQSYLAMVRG
jgi:hypothetical protein